MISFLESAIVSLVSFVAGILGTVSGGGGGAFVVPALVSSVNEPPGVLIGSVFLMYLTVSTTGLLVYGRKKLVDYRSGIILAIPAVPGVVMGTLLENTISDLEFKLGVGLLTGCFALMMLIFGKKGSGTDRMAQTSAPSFSGAKPLFERYSRQRTVIDSSGRIFSYTPNFAFGLAINFAAGVLSGLFGAGAAIIIVPTTILIVGMPSHVAIATTRIILVALNVSAVITHVDIGAVNWYFAIILAVGAMIGALAGAKIAFKIPPTMLTRLIAIILLILGGYLVAIAVF